MVRYFTRAEQMRRIINVHLLAITAILGAIILYGSLYPFAFRPPVHDIGSLRSLIESWTSGRRTNDLLANIVFYAPFGFFLFSAMRPEIGTKFRLTITVIMGFSLSTSLELVQYYIGRWVSASDIYANITGTFLGAIAGRYFGPNAHWSIFEVTGKKAFAAILLLSWVGYRLFPFFPSIEPEEIWNALEPLLFGQNLGFHELYRFTISWLIVCALLEAILERSRSLYVFPYFALGILCAKIVIAGRVLFWAEIVGALIALVLWILLLKATERVRALILASFLGVYVIAWRLEPFQLLEEPREFGWIPFLSLIRGSLFANVQVFFEKFFYYGALVWLIAWAGVRPIVSGYIVAAMLLILSWAAIYLPNGSAEVTDACMALIIATIMGVLANAAKNIEAFNQS